MLDNSKVYLPAFGFCKHVLFHGRADNEPVDPKNYLEERCKPQCVKSLYDYEVSATFLITTRQTIRVNQENKW
uniref:Uncharacterized protein n=1 Tax=Aegilops tauschii subsp. strangulata TaxID=200361 RepID=A0A453K8M2_AEGTS